MGCGMSARFKRSRPSVSATESTQQEFLTEAEVDSVRARRDTTTSNKRSKSMGSLFHSRKVCNFGDAATSDSSVHAPVTLKSEKKRRSSLAQDLVSVEQFELPGEMHIETQKHMPKFRRSVDERQSLLATDSEPNITTAASSSIFASSSGVEVCGSSTVSIDTAERHAVASVDSGFAFVDGAKSSTPERHTNGSCDNKVCDLGAGVVNDSKHVTCGRETESEIESVSYHGNGQIEHSPSQESGDVREKDGTVDEVSNGDESFTVHKDLGIELPEELNGDEVDGNGQSSAHSPSSPVQLQQNGGTSAATHAVHCPKLKIGVKTLEQIVEVGKMVSNPAEHSVVYESPLEEKMIGNGERHASTSLTLSDVADEEPLNVVTKATASSFEQPLLDGDVVEDELWPGVVIVHVHQDFFNDFDDCFDDDEVLTPVTPR